MERNPLSRRRENGALLFAIAVFFALACAMAEIRLFWYDEIFTRQVVKLGSWSRMVTALRHGIDLQPSFFYWLTGWTRPIGGEEIGFRLPAICGFTFTTFALYKIARRWFPPGYAIATALLPSILFFPAMGMDARPYGFVIGCAALALLSWTFRDRRPNLGRAGYLAGVVGAAATHYYAFLIAVPFGAASAWTLWRKRRVDWWTVAGCGCAVLPNLLALPLIRAEVAIYKHGAWNRPGWRVMMYGAYGWSLELLGSMLVVILVVLWKETKPASPEPSPPGESLACWAGFTLIPFLAVAIAKATSGLYTLRYYSMYSLGFSLLLTFLIARSVRRWRMLGYILAAAAVATFGDVALTTARTFQTQRLNILLSCDHFATLFDQPQYAQSRFLVGDPHVAVQLGLYCDDLRDRIVFGADPERSMAYFDYNTDHKAMLILRESPPIAIAPLEDVLRGQRHPLLVDEINTSFLREYLATDPRYSERFRFVQDGGYYTIYCLDPPASSTANEGEEK